ncbi:unnamed protein product [Rotaria sp. Silwood1]|nr:unnamed protein product [Rotaria sp. Silwood1]CAF3328436.1 unnamed protein product [Rotaria sp. Silwood1]CAF3351677.1 unnamed protein product [Rotaria sp. Silwood1]CAF3356472.1 unnamed protein product [Rotaria sp. Silwood1]CAF4512227.1 unnamed protein product [Rotaria sp. Silwood1]
MNDIYWHEKRTMSSKQLSSPPPTQPRRSYENTLRTNHHQQMDFRYNSHSTPTTGRTDPLSYLHYPTVSSRSNNNNNNNNENFPYSSSVHGVYRQFPPTFMASPSPLHPHQNRHIDIRNQSHYSQQRQVSRSVSDDYFTTKYDDINRLSDDIYGDEDENGHDDEDNSSEVFNYIFEDTGDVISSVSSPMATYRNVGHLNSPNTNNNNNNNPNLSSNINRDSIDYASTKYNQQQTYKSLTMPKSHYQNITTTKDYLPTDNDTNYLTASSSLDTEMNSNISESTKRMNNPNGKFSIHKIIRQGISSLRTRKKPPSMSTPPPPQLIPSTNTVYANTSTFPPSQPSSSIEHYVTNNDDVSQVPPPTAVRSISVDSISNNTPPQKIIVTEPVTVSTARANSVDSVTIDFDRPPTANRTYIQPSWTNSSTSTATTITTITTPINTESITRLTPIPATRVLPVQFTENNKISTPRSPPLLPPPPPLSSVASSPPPSNISTITTTATTKTVETNTATNSLTKVPSNPLKIPPPVAPKPDASRLTPIRTNYLNNNNNTNNNLSYSTLNPTPPQPPPPPLPPPPTTTSVTFTTIPSASSSFSTSTTTIEQRRSVSSDKFTTNQFKPIHDNNTVIYANVTPTPMTRPIAANNILALQEKFQIRSSPVNTTNSSPSPIPVTLTTSNMISTTVTNSSSPSTNSSSTPTTTVIQTNKQITVQDIDTTKYEEIPAKEPDFTRQPEKSALKKSHGVKRRVIPVFRENQRPSPRPSPKIKPTVLITGPPSTTTATTVNDEHNSDNEHNENSSSDDDGDTTDTKKRFANVKRNDSLARFLKDRPLPNELFDKHILVKSLDERKNERETIETKLERKLSLRPSQEELEARNILRAKTQAELTAEKEEKKRYLIRKLSFRPSIQELRDRKIIRFCDYIEVSECDDVDRRADKPWTRLTPRDKQMIRKELNEYKSSEMEIHPDSAKYTRFHPP